MNGSEKPAEEYDMIFKIVIIGDAGVGKTNLLLRYTKGEFKLDSKSTIGVEYAVKQVQVNDQVVRAQFWDTAGQERFRAMTSLYYRGAKGVIIVYDVTRAQTFASVEKWVEEIRRHQPEGETVIMLLGNKCDLDNLRDVPEESARKKAEELGIPFLETSALEGSNVDAAFESIVDVIYNCTHGNPTSPGFGKGGATEPLLIGRKLSNSFYDEEDDGKKESEKGCMKGRCC